MSLSYQSSSTATVSAQNPALSAPTRGLAALRGMGYEGAVQALRPNTERWALQPAGQLSASMSMEDKLKANIKALVADRFGCSYRACFDHYATDNKVDSAGLDKLLEDAGYGKMARPVLVKGCMSVFDKDADGCVDWDEFVAGVGQDRVDGGACT